MTWLDDYLRAQQLPDSYRAVVGAVHEPLVHDILARLPRRAGRPLIVGLSGAPGSGKSTLAAGLLQLLRQQHLHCEAVSLDDFYLDRSRRHELARSVHPLLATRGVPGTHDVALGMLTFAALRAGDAAAVPVFDKSRDEPYARAAWRNTTARLDILLFEGWCVGARPQRADDLQEPVNALERDEDPQAVWRGWVNEQLRRRYQPWFALLDMLVLLRVDDFSAVLRGRREQESKLRRVMQNRGGDVSRLLNEAQLQRFVSHYERLTRHILAEMPARADRVVRAPLCA